MISAGKAMDMISLWPAVVNTLSVLAGIVMVGLSGTPWALVAPLVPVALIVLRQRRALVPRAAGGLGRYLTARSILLTAVGASLFTAGALSALALASLLLGLAALVLEPILRSAHGIAVPYASGFPGRQERNEPAFPYGWMFPLDLLALCAMVLSPLAPSALLMTSLVLSVAALVLAGAAGADIVRRITIRRRFQAALPEILEEMGPVFYLYWNAPPRSAFQVTMWLPYLERLGVPFVLVTRTVPNFRQLAEATDHPVLLRRSLTDLDALIVPSARGVFYVNNAMRNNHMVRYAELTHIQLLHGESDKASSATPIIRMYDRDFVAGQAAIDRFEKFGVPMPEDIFRIVGRPQVEDVRGERGPIGELENPSVLYAPTWLGYQAETNYSSLPVGPAIVKGLLERGCRVVFRPHPYSSRSPELRAACEEIRALLTADAAATGREHLFGEVAETEMSVTDCFNAADAMISDVSAVVGDFLHSGKPLAMVSPRTGAEEFTEQFPMARAAYVLVVEGQRLVDLDARLDDLLVADPGREERKRWATYYLGDIPREGYAERFVQVAKAELGLIDPREVKDLLPTAEPTGSV